MCASFMLRTRADDYLDLVSEFRTDIDEYLDTLIVPHRPAPVISIEGHHIVLSAMNFSLVPRWSKVRKPKFATHNARLETVLEKPTWKDAFKRRHCMIPLTHFIEPIYEGEHAGFMVSFYRDEKTWLLAAGIWEEWTDSSNGEVLASFSILTTTPPPFIADTGHDRCPVFLDRATAQEWLRPESRTSEEWVQELRHLPSEAEFAVERFRPMRPGWEKRK